MPRPKQKISSKKIPLKWLTPELQLALSKMDDEAANAIRQALEDQADEKEVVRQLKSEQDRQNKEKHFWVTVIQNQFDNEPFAFVGAAGITYKLDKGIRMPVPQSVINALSYAFVKGYNPVIDEQGNRKMQRTEYPRYPLQIDGECSLEDARKWKAEQQQKAKRRENVMDEPRQEEEIVGRPEIEYGPMQVIGAGDE